jgi:hypothetical protein
MKQTLIFTLKVWLTVIIIVPIPLLILQNNVGWTTSHYIKEYYWVCIGELLFYSPLIIVFFFFTFWVNRKLWTMKHKKPVILFQAEFLQLLAVQLFLYFVAHIRIFDLYHLESIFINIIVIGLGILFYNLTSVNDLTLIKSKSPES